MSDKKWLPIVSNLEFTLERSTLSDDEWNAIQQIDAEVEFASFMFSDLKFHCFKFKQLAEVLNAYQSSGQKFASITIRKRLVGILFLHEFIFIINRNFLSSLKNISSASTVRFSLQGNPEGKLGDNWERRGSDYKVQPFIVDLSQFQQTISGGDTVEHWCRAIHCTQELNLLSAGSSNIRLKFKLEVSLEVSADFEIPESSPLKLSNSSILENLRNRHATKDFTVIAAEGDKISCHGIFLSAQSPVLEAMISSKMQEGETRVLKMDDMGNEALTHFIGYFYGLEIPMEISSDTALQLFQAGHKYKIKSLEQGMASFILYKDESWYSVDTCLELFFFTKNLNEYSDLNKHVFSIISRIPSAQLRSSDAFNELKPVDALELTLKLNDALQLSSQN